MASAHRAITVCRPPVITAACAIVTLVMKTLSIGTPTRFAAPSVNAAAASGLR